FHSYALGDAPPSVLETGLRAARCIGDGLYGVDLKETDDGVVVIEVNDNPNLEHGIEDAAEKDEVWIKLTRWFTERVDRRSAGSHWVSISDDRTRSGNAEIQQSDEALAKSKKRKADLGKSSPAEAEPTCRGLGPVGD